MSKDKPCLENNLGLARHYASQYKGFLKEYPTLEYEDLLQEALLALDRACKAYDSTKGVKFEYLAAVWMKQAMINLLNATGATVRKPQSRKKNESPGHDEAHSNFMIIQTDIPDIDDIEIADDNEDDDETEQLQTMEQALGKLRVVDRQMLQLYYGLGNYKKLTLVEIAEKLGVSKGRAGQKVKFAEEKLRHQMNVPAIQKKKTSATKRNYKLENARRAEYFKEYRRKNKDKLLSKKKEWLKLKAMVTQMETTTREGSRGFTRSIKNARKYQRIKKMKQQENEQL